ncbi:MAG: prepilin-type N-terminal cleavage/methylation domain-containing protein, partial [Candidatus Moraniibacteriota bacterium]
MKKNCKGFIPSSNLNIQRAQKNIFSGKKLKKNLVRGFSLIELLFAGALFAVFATGVVEVLLFGLETDRLGEETTIATEYASQGLEAVRSIKAQS